MKYLQNYVDTYKIFQGECSNVQNRNAYCDAFKEYFAKKDPYLLSNWINMLEEKEEEAKEEAETEPVREKQVKVDKGVLDTHQSHHQYLDGAAGFQLDNRSTEGTESAVTPYPLPDSADEGRSNGTIISTSCVGLTGFLFLLYKVNKKITLK
ncbi:hypothetical protein PVNG_05986 [Plasmodium vivax North Korean]|uniref:Uncharacterized protein n=1 Tax=Plasmodium vivax North Korean TaxID=1035514 RepID=A0A0J9W697_PLAVI|nr:hypothetical protein PVNG_05986 [Plasmodium vivax North Korean]